MLYQGLFVSIYTGWRFCERNVWFLFYTGTITMFRACLVFSTKHCSLIFFDNRNRRTFAFILAHSFTRIHLTAIYKSISDKIYFPLRQVSPVATSQRRMEYITKVRKRQELRCLCYSTLLGEKYRGLFFLDEKWLVLVPDNNLRLCLIFMTQNS